MDTFISEEETRRLISNEAAFARVAEALIAASSSNAQVFPAVIARASEPQNLLSLKSGSTADLAGLKVGSFWRVATSILRQESPDFAGIFRLR
ncbi:hypothetical protein [Fulvimarina sp. MAC3]|uniref:hypothetical protein n=1 Tax=Fulvimarina sp. MAC3 TaxID=3148887 RepID=UPI0031FC56B6